ncbi:LysR family transcriptional regulator [Aureimonas fodinaquatilis]|uniref:LysR family transcriptional regulator n=1 Tax=Aureimonas fodinaquatilis TaxID=2565783 RepID=A0A5B0DUU4_9HYPH|nr:LysR substrate-binding domain-containing protein [Aureimonas fodinaquatilis]KAA0969350.1 LysR family transcriptional regulator [Aureimonas fodinaquatilis]
MQTPRRFLPSTGLLIAFEAAARTASFTAAARELNLTQSAVSRQIKALEEQIGVALFVRERQTVRLTDGGEAYARDIREALRRISAASLHLRANPAGGTLNLGCLPTLAARWLVPKLPLFRQAFPHVMLNLATRMTEFDFQRDTVDAAIRNGQPVTGNPHRTLMVEMVAPLAAPDLASPDAKPQDLLRKPLLHMVSRPDAWERWFLAKGVEPDMLTGMLLDDFASVAEAAKAGMGVALLPLFMFKTELASGALVQLCGHALVEGATYHLAWPSERDQHPPLLAFRQWLDALSENQAERMI